MYSIHLLFPMFDSQKCLIVYFSFAGAVSSEDPGSAKKKKFKPWKSLRNLFKKKRPGKEEVEAEESLGIKSKSTGELNRPDTEEEEAEG